MANSQSRFWIVFFFAWAVWVNDSFANDSINSSVALVIRKTASADAKFMSGSSFIRPLIRLNGKLAKRCSCDFSVVLIVAGVAGVSKTKKKYSKQRY